MSGDDARYTLLCESRQSYQNLCRLITPRKLRAGAEHPKPGREALSMFDDLAAFSEGLLCMTGGEEGPLARSFQERRASKDLERLLAIFDSVFVELQRHLDPEEERNQAAVALARSWKLPLVATNGVCCASPAERPVLDVFTSLQHKTTLADAEQPLERNSERYFKSTAESAPCRTTRPLLPAVLSTRRAIAARLP